MLDLKKNCSLYLIVSCNVNLPTLKSFLDVVDSIEYSDLWLFEIRQAILSPALLIWKLKNIKF